MIVELLLLLGRLAHAGGVVQQREHKQIKNKIGRTWLQRAENCAMMKQENKNAVALRGVGAPERLRR